MKTIRIIAIGYCHPAFGAVITKALNNPNVDVAVDLDGDHYEPDVDINKDDLASWERAVLPWADSREEEF